MHSTDSMVLSYTADDEMQTHEIPGDVRPGHLFGYSCTTLGIPSTICTFSEMTESNASN